MGDRSLICPSAQPDLAHSRIYGVIGGSSASVEVVYLSEELPVTPELIAMCAPVSPTEVFRFAAPCQGNRCQHFDGADCTLVNNLVQISHGPTQDLKECPIRTSCRWFAQQGAAACARCTEIVTTYYNPPTDLDHAAVPFRQRDT